MKKSLLTLAVLATAGFVQAATLNWTIMGVPNASDGYTAMLFMLEQTSTSGTAADPSWSNFGTANTTVAKVTELADAGNYDGLVDLAAKVLPSTGNISNQATGYYGNFGAGDSLKAFALIVDKDKKNYFLTGEKSASWTSSTGAKLLGFGSQANATYKTFGVPEPATGALALAGIALLFRRRK